jgi:hypothetical protein
MKKKILFISMFAFSLFITHSCSDEFLEKEPKGQYSPSVLKTREGVEGMLVGAYGLLDGIGTGGYAPWYAAVSNWVYGGIASDDAYKGTDAGDQPEQTFIERYVWQPTNTHFYGKWRHLYDGISRTNDVLVTLREVEDISNERRSQIEAEARFLRGHYHFEAKKMWNNIPYLDEETWNPADPESTLVSNTEDAWPQIEADFQFAMENLPETQNEPGRPTKYAAMAYLAKSHMFQGFPNGQADPARMQAAKKLLDQIIASGQYSLADNFHDNFAAEARNNGESIFEIQYSLTAAADGGGNHGDGLAWPYNAGPGGCCGFYQPSHNLVNAYKTDENGLPMIDTFDDQYMKSDEGISSSESFEPYQDNLDSRLDWTVGRRGIPYLDWGVHPGRDWVRDQAYGGPYSPKKHIASQAKSGTSGWTNLNANNYRLIRYSHVLLWAAEAEAALGNLEQAREYVNMIRARAANPEGFVQVEILDAEGNPTGEFEPAANYVVGLYNQPWTDPNAAQEAIRFEQRLEFAMEGHRFFDLVRWNIAEPVLNEYISKEQKLQTYLNGARFEERNRYYPIPENAITFSSQNGKATLQQNPGY